MTAFSEWLQLAARDGRGGLAAQPPSIVRGYTRAFKLNLSAHEVYGDWTDGAFVADLRASPDATGAALASFTVTVGTPAGGVTPVTFVLAPAAQTGLPIDSDIDGMVETLFQVDYTPTGGVADPIIQSRIFISGAV